MGGIDISGAEKCMGVLVAAQPVGQADICVAPHGAAQHPCKGLQTQPTKTTMGFFATLVACLNPCLNVF